MMRVVKTYGAHLGLSSCFRQWRAKSHCKYLHGYALEFSFVFEARSLDENGWVIDFGGLKPLKTWLESTFDHKTLVAGDDPLLLKYHELSKAGLMDVLIFPGGVGCEAFSRVAYAKAQEIISTLTDNRVKVISCSVREHGANAVIFEPNQQ